MAFLHLGRDPRTGTTRHRSPDLVPPTREAPAVTIAAPTAVWRDPSRPVDERVDALLAEMTLAEKVAQLGSVWLGVDAATGDVAPMQNVFSRATSFAEATVHGLGQLTRVFGTAPVTAAEGVSRVARAAAVADVLDPAGSPGHRARGVPDRVHHVPGDGLPGGAGLGRHLRSRRWCTRWPRRSAATWPRSVSTRACRRCSTWSATTAGAGSRRRWGRTRTSSPRSARRTCAVWRRTASSPPSSTSPGTPRPGPPATTRRSRMGPRELADVILPPFEHAVR